MFAAKERFFTVYEKPEHPEPSERVVLVREGFAIWAFVFDAFWLAYTRQWWPLAFYVGLGFLLGFLAKLFGASEMSLAILHIGLKFLLAVSAADMQGFTLKRRGYRMGGVLVAESEMHAQRRYHEFAA